jgi:hypothetical protein
MAVRRLIDSLSDADKWSRKCVTMRLRCRTARARLVEYDAPHRRLWIGGQRCHHGAGGTLVALTACAGLIAAYVPQPKPNSPARPFVALVLAGGALMAHDWKDRSVWFQRGRGPGR